MTEKPTGVPFSLRLIQNKEKEVEEYLVNKAFEKWQKDNPELVEKIFDEVMDKVMNPDKTEV